MAELHEASFYRKLKNKEVKCNLCMRTCSIKDGCRGQCGVRKNIGGKFYSLIYGKTVSMEIDPIEKKPLFNFKPGTYCMGISTFGCNFMCKHCQNWTTSQGRREDVIAKVPNVSPKEIVEQTLDAGIKGIAYTYTEPTIFAEYALDTMKIAKKKGLYNVWVSNGYMTRECIDAIAPFLDAINVDLKGDARFYKEIVGNANVEFVKDNIVYLHKKKVHIEVTNLIVPTFNDSDKAFEDISEFIASIDKAIPLHFTRFWPQYKLTNLPSTDVESLHRAKEFGNKAGLKYVYVGNVAEELSTNCPKCNAVLVKRIGFSAQPTGLVKGGKCKSCGFKTGFVV